MELNQRQKDILGLVNEKQRVTVQYLAKVLFFSEMTVRRDLDKLERGGYLKRYHGGAIALSQAVQYPIEQRMHINEQEKRRMAKQAEKHLRNGQTVFILGSSTCAYLLPCLRSFEDLHIFTNSVQFLQILSEMKIRCTLSGGEYFVADKILLGRVAENFFRSMNYDIAIIACDGIDEDGTVTVIREDGAELVRIGFRNAAKRIVIADHTKLGCRGTYNVCNTGEADDVIVI